MKRMDPDPRFRVRVEPGEEGQGAVDNLLKLLDLERLEEDLFRGKSPTVDVQRVFGGQVAGQALVAAGRTVPDDRNVHSLHSYFLRPGDPNIPIIYEVARTRDGRSFTTRHVEAIQHGKVIFTLSAQFQIDEGGSFEHQDVMPDVPNPESLPRHGDVIKEAVNRERVGSQIDMPRPIDLRYVSTPAWARDAPADARNALWMKADGRLPDDRLIHICALTYASDMTLLDASMNRHGLNWSDIVGASLDHAVWFHRTFRADEWLLYTSTSPSASSNRAFCVGQFYSQDGQLVASTAQEGLVRIDRRSRK